MQILTIEKPFSGKQRDTPFVSVETARDRPRNRQCAGYDQVLSLKNWLTRGRMISDTGTPSIARLEEATLELLHKGVSAFHRAVFFCFAPEMSTRAHFGRGAPVPNGWRNIGIADRKFIRPGANLRLRACSLASAHASLLTNPRHA